MTTTAKLEDVKKPAEFDAIVAAAPAVVSLAPPRHPSPPSGLQVKAPVCTILPCVCGANIEGWTWTFAGQMFLLSRMSVAARPSKGHATVVWRQLCYTVHS